MTFYPHEDDVSSGTLEQRLDALMEGAERFKAAVLDAAEKPLIAADAAKRRTTPRGITVAFNWEEIARTLREIREIPESNSAQKLSKADKLMKLAEVYEVLRGAKMPKLEAVRIALVNEAAEIKAGAQVA